MKLFLLLSLFSFVANASIVFRPEKFGKQYAERMRVEFESGQLTGLAARTDQALDRVVAKALSELRKRNDDDFADQAENEWSEKFSGYLTKMVSNTKDIGDHKPLIEWLAKFYDHVESVIGVVACKSLHLSDIKTFNFCIPIVFHPCTFPMDQVTGARIDEYRNHFSEGAVYYGLIPVVTYWAVEIACTVATYGSGFMLCGVAADAGEFVMGKWIAPKLSDAIYNRQCGT